MEFKDILKTRRLELDLTLDDVARHVGVSGATVSRWENGDIENVRRDKIAKLAEILKVTPSYLMGWPEPQAHFEQNNAAAKAADDPDENYTILSRNARNMSPENRAKLVELAKMMFDDFKEDSDN